jgi:hypothetical protein
MLGGLFSELVLIDIDETKAMGEAMDLNHGMPFAKPARIYQGDYVDSKGSDIIIITAGANQKEGETRIDLVHKNTEVFKSIISSVTKYNSPDDTLLLVVTNPVDVLTYVTWKLSGFPASHVMGSSPYKNSLMDLLELERAAFNLGYTFATVFFAGRCMLCEKCNVENGICKNPMIARFSAEAMGINLLKTAENAGMELKFSQDSSPTPMAILLID